MAIGIGRRQLICVLGSAAVAWPLAARAGKTARIGFVGNPLDNPVTALGYPAFLDELKKSGLSVGENLAIERQINPRIPNEFSPKRLTWCGRTWNCWS
jgi:hypothetical protein